MQGINGLKCGGASVNGKPVVIRDCDIFSTASVLFAVNGDIGISNIATGYEEALKHTSLRHLLVRSALWQRGCDCISNREKGVMIEPLINRHQYNEDALLTLLLVLYQSQDENIPEEHRTEMKEYFKKWADK